jgi:hypothetical protein
VWIVSIKTVKILADLSDSLLICSGDGDFLESFLAARPSVSVSLEFYVGWNVDRN